MSDHPLESEIRAQILAQTGERGPDKSICPSEVAREVASSEGEDWRRHLTAVRQEAVRLAQAGKIEILRKGKPVEPGDVRGVIRLRQRGDA